MNGLPAVKIKEIEYPVARRSPIGVFIVCAIRLFCDGLTQMLPRDDGIDVVGNAEGLDDAIRRIRETSPDLILVDASGADGLSVIRALADHERSFKILAVGVSEVATEILASVQAGAIGYVSRRASRQQAIQAIRLAASGRAIYSLPSRTTRLAGVDLPKDEQAREQQQTFLTKREAEVLELVDEGLSNKEISQALFIEVATVKNHVHSILQKLSLRRRGQVGSWIRGQYGARLGA
jgi:DNA-binding NarL/FixJ family response regulator